MDWTLPTTYILYYSYYGLTQFTLRTLNTRITNVHSHVTRSHEINSNLVFSSISFSLSLRSASLSVQPLSVQPLSFSLSLWSIALFPRPGWFPAGSALSSTCPCRVSVQTPLPLPGEALSFDSHHNGAHREGGFATEGQEWVERLASRRSSDRRQAVHAFGTRG